MQRYIFQFCYMNFFFRGVKNASIHFQFCNMNFCLFLSKVDFLTPKFPSDLPDDYFQKIMFLPTKPKNTFIP